MTLPEKYRPTRWEDVIGQHKAVKALRRLVERGEVGGQSVWLSGATGIGKTTLALLLASEIADRYFIEEVDATALTPSRLADIESTMHLYSMGKGGRAWIVNEAHRLRPGVVTALLTLLEHLPDHVLFVFTTTSDGLELFEDTHLDASPLLGRCICLKLTNQGLAETATPYLKAIAAAENLDGKPARAYLARMKLRNNSIRACIEDIAAGAMVED